MRSNRFAYRLGLALWFASLSLWPASNALANKRACQELDQRYAQIARGASPVEINNLLFQATDKRCEDVARRLLEAGASLEARDRFGAKPLSHAAVVGDAKLVALFLEHGAPIDARNLDHSTALYKAAENGRLAIVELLVERGANADLPGRSGITPLAAAAYMGSTPIVQFLLDKGADPNWLDATQKTAIVYAVGRGFPEVVRVLLDEGVDVNARYGHNLTALMWAAGYSSEAGVKDMMKVIELLIERGARLDDQDDRGRSALMIAAELDHEQAVDLLLASGADKTLRDKQGKTASDLTSLTSLREKLAATH